MAIVRRHTYECFNIMNEISEIMGLGKLLEQLMLLRLKKEIETKGRLFQEQHSFREGRSTISALKRAKKSLIA